MSASLKLDLYYKSEHEKILFSKRNSVQAFHSQEAEVIFAIFALVSYAIEIIGLFLVFVLNDFHVRGDRRVFQKTNLVPSFLFKHMPNILLLTTAVF